MLALAIVNLLAGFVIGLYVITFRMEWFARIGTIIMGVVTCTLTPHPLSIAFLAGFVLQTSLRWWHLKTKKHITINV